MEERFFNEDRFGAGLTVVDFWAPWCGPCRMQGPVLEELAAAHPEISVVKVNVDEEGEMAAALGIMSIPTLVLLKQRKPVKTVVGFHDIDSLEDLIEEYK